MRPVPAANARLPGLLEPGWRRQLSAGVLAGTLDVEPEMLGALARTLGDQARAGSPMETARRWPACVVVAVVHTAVNAPGADRDGGFWLGWHRAAGLRMTRRSAGEWDQAFLAALDVLSVVPASATGTAPVSVREAVLAHARPTDPPSADDGRHRRPRLRLDPFGRGVLGTPEPGDLLTWGPERPERPVLPDEAADPDDPLLAFDGNGELVGSEFPAEPVWVLYPADSELRSDVPARVMLTSRLPLTWRGWRLVQLDLRPVGWLALVRQQEPAGHDGAAPGSAQPAAAQPDITMRHLVRGRSRPNLVTAAPLPGVTTTTGAQVFAALPEVLLPPGTGTWHVEARRADNGAVLGDVTATADDWRPDLLWQRAARPVLATVTITATPVNTVIPAAGAAQPPAQAQAPPGLRRAVTVAEGLSVSYFPLPRLTSDRGLEPAEAKLTTAPGMTASPQAALLPAQEATATVACVAGHAVMSLRVTPPHIRLRIEPEPGSKPEPGSRGQATGWHHHGPLPLTAAQVQRGGALMIDLPGIDRDPPIEVVATRTGGVTRASADSGAQAVQVLEPTRQGRYPLRRMLDTVTALGGAELRIAIDGRSVTIATVSAREATPDPWLNP
ncbi:MAG TPA: hypothetical protein VI365_26405 [Trebonia sp.]